VSLLGKKKKKMRNTISIVGIAEKIKVLGNPRNVGIIDYLANFDGPISSEEIAKHLGLRKENLHKYIQKLEKTGYVERVPQKGTKELRYILSSSTSSDVIDHIEELVKADIKKKLEEYKSLK